MLAIVIVLTVLFVIKQIVDYVNLKSGFTSISTVKGFLIGFDREEVIEGWENQETKEVQEVKHVTFEIALGFISLILTWQEDYEEDNENNSRY